MFDLGACSRFGASEVLSCALAHGIRAVREPTAATTGLSLLQPNSTDALTTEGSSCDRAMIATQTIAG